jgi:carbonic anhydrase
MSCPNATAPIEISLNNITNKCDYKCAYSFNYHNSTSIATNRGDYISLSYDSATTSPVTYNSAGYNVKEIRIYTPSLHSYSGSKTDGEMIIIHQSNTNAKPLLVCIPIIMNNSMGQGSAFIQGVIDTLSKNAPSNGESTTTATYNLNTVVPRTPFFSYSGTEPYQPCSTAVDYVVFDPANYSIGINSSSLTTLQSIIQSNSYDVKSSDNSQQPIPPLFYNETGAKDIDIMAGEFVIDCKPISQSTNTNYQSSGNSDSSGSMSLSELFNSRVFQGVLFAIITATFIYVIFVTLPKEPPPVVQQGGAAAASLFKFFFY